MHYKNGTPAQEGDAVIMKRWTGKVAVGVLHTISTTSSSCNGQVAVPIPGGVQHDCVTVGEIYSAADALQALQSQENLAPTAEQPTAMAAS